MSEKIRLVIYKKKCVYDDILILPKLLCLHTENYESKNIELQNNNNLEYFPLKLRKTGFNAYLISAYIHHISFNDNYKKSAVKLLENFMKMKTANLNLAYSVIFIKLKTPKKQFLDYIWNDKMAQMVMERQEIDHAMSWLSTLGGAFSALGDQFDRCAKVAGKISLEQFKLAIQLGDPELEARCKLYAALSLLQQGYLKVSGQMVRKIYNFAIKNGDIRLQKMCQGVWAKWKYCYSQRRKKERIKQSKSFLNR